VSEPYREREAERREGECGEREREREGGIERVRGEIERGRE
jgi:hypothetical protein